MTRPVPRLHRLPRRLDYTLIPAPLDLSLPLVTEKSSLPAIIVTPSSPSSAHDFSIAFLAPPPKPSIRDRFIVYLTPPNSIPVQSSDSNNRLFHHLHTGVPCSHSPPRCEPPPSRIHPRRRCTDGHTIQRLVRFRVALAHQSCTRFCHRNCDTFTRLTCQGAQTL